MAKKRSFYAPTDACRCGAARFRRKQPGQLKIAGVIVAVIVFFAGLSAWADNYGTHSWRFRIHSSDSVEISGVQNASRAQVMEVAGADIGKNIFYVPLDERRNSWSRFPGWRKRP